MAKMLTSSVGGGGASKPPKFWFVKNPGKILEIWAKYLKIWEKSMKILAKWRPTFAQ